MSSTIKQNAIPQEVSIDPEVLKDMFVSMVTALGTGSSKNKKVSELILKIANIYGLQTALDSKITKNVSGGEGSIPTYLADGDIDFSTFKIGSFDSAASIGSLTDNGFYTAEGSGSGYENSIMGYLAAVLTINDTQIVLSTDRGLWYRTYDAGWSIPSYIGGSVNNITVSRLQADWLVANNSLTVGAVYRIFDNANYEYIVLTAATSNRFFDDGLAYAACPIHRNGDFIVGEESVHFNGQWIHNLGNTIGTVSIHGNRCYANTTGAHGTQADFVLDSTNWLLINFRINPEFYSFEWHGINYDYTNDYVRQEWDTYGNRFGDITLPDTDDGFRCHMNDWGINYEYDETNKIIFKENNLTRLYGTTPTLGEDYNNIITIKGNNGTGSIKDYLIPDNTTPGATPVVHFEIMDNIFIGDTLPADTVVNGKSAPIIDSVTMMQYGAYPVYNRICGNKIYPGGKITGVYRVEGQRSCTIADNDIKDVITTSAASSGFPASMKELHIARSTIGGSFEASYYDGGNESRVALVNTVIHAGAVIKATANGDVSITDSVLYTSRTFTSSASRKESKGSIFASLYYGAGEFSYPQGATFQAPVYGSGCATTVVGSNGVTIAGTNISDTTITIVHAGWYKFKYEASAQSPTKIDVEAKAFKGATAIPMLYKKITYVAIDEWINSSISGIVQLAAGDVVTVKYASPGGGTTTLLTGQINVTVEYKGQ